MRVVAAVAVALMVLSACGDSSGGSHASPTTSIGANLYGPGAPTAAQLVEARRLVNIGDLAQQPPARVVKCVAEAVVRNPGLDEIANDIAQMSKDLRQAVMYAYLQCGFSYILDSYMRFAPAGLSHQELACIRSKFTQLDQQRLAEVIVLDPDAGFTGPLVIHACETNAPGNPLLHNGALISMGGS